MTPFEEAVLFDALEQADAWRRFHDPSFCGTLKAAEVLDLALQAGYSRPAAEKAAQERGWARIKEELPP